MLRLDPHLSWPTQPNEPARGTGTAQPHDNALVSSTRLRRLRTGWLPLVECGSSGQGPSGGDPSAWIAVGGRRRVLVDARRRS